MTVQTSNAMVGSSQTELLTAFYSGGASIEDGFQSVHEVLVIGTTELMAKFKTDFNGANAGVWEEINTLTKKFKDLIVELEPWAKKPDDVTTNTPTTPGPTKQGDLWNYIGGGLKNLEGLIKGDTDIQDQGNRQMAGWDLSAEYAMETLAVRQHAEGGIVKRAHLGIVGEAGPEAIIPLGRGNPMGKTININITGDVYGIDDLDRVIEESVSKYSSRIGGSY
jgi:hypothetical protein